MSYGLPAFRVQGKVIAGFAAFTNHLSYLPHSGSVFTELDGELSQYKTSKGALQFPIDTAAPQGTCEEAYCGTKATGIRPQEVSAALENIRAACKDADAELALSVLGPSIQLSLSLGSDRGNSGHAGRADSAPRIPVHLNSGQQGYPS